MYNPNIHNRQSIRLKGFDYSSAGLYFITICTQNKECLFGHIENEKMILNEGGEMANRCWLSIPIHYPNVILHQHVIIPNHVHGVLELTERFEGMETGEVGVENFQPLGALQKDEKINQYGKIIPRSIGSIVKGFKIGVTKWFRSNTDIYSVWQRNYHEHIIRNQQSYDTIANYILNNPVLWKEDKFYAIESSSDRRG